jgi:hypothetical protein
MYYVETRADNSGYTNRRVICLVVIGSSFDSEQVFQVSNGYLSEYYLKLELLLTMEFYFLLGLFHGDVRLSNPADVY